MESISNAQISTEDAESQADAYIKKYTRKKGEPVPDTPIACSFEDFRTMHRLVKALNEVSSQEMKQRSHVQALHLLEKAERLAYVMKKKSETMDPSVDLQRLIGRSESLTFNNLGCFYMSRQKYVTALEYMEKTLRVEQVTKLPAKDLGTTCSNVTAVLSKLGRHEEAKEYAERAVTLLERADEGSDGKSADLALYLATAYFNFSVECEYLGKLDQATSLLRQGLEIAEPRLGAEHSMCQQMKERLKPKHGLLDVIKAETPKSLKSEEFSNVSVSDDQRAELKVVHQSYRALGGVTHKVIIYDRANSHMLRCIAFTRTKDRIHKLSIPYSSSLSIPEILDRLTLSQGKLILSQKRPSSGQQSLFTVSAHHGEATYSAVISSDSQTKSVTWSDSTPTQSDDERRFVLSLFLQLK